MRIVGTKQEAEVLARLTQNDTWAFPFIIDMIRCSSIEIADYMAARRFRVGDEEMTAEDILNRMVANEPATIEPSEEKDVVAEATANSVPTEPPKQQMTASALAIARLRTIGCIYENGIATSETGLKCEVFIQQEDEKPGELIDRVESHIHEKSNSTLIVTKSQEDKNRVVGLARQVLGAQDQDGKSWFVTSSDMTWARKLVFANLRMEKKESGFEENVEERAGLHYAARKNIKCTGDWIENLKHEIANEAEEELGTASDLPYDEQLATAKEVIQRISKGEINRASLAQGLTVRKMIDLDILEPFAKHNVLLTDKGMLLAKAWGVEQIAKGPTSADNLANVVQSIIGGKVFGRDVLLVDIASVIRVRCARDHELEEAVVNDGCNHMFFAVSDTSTPSLFAEAAKGFCDCVGAWTISELHNDPELPLKAATKQ